MACADLTDVAHHAVRVMGRIEPARAGRVVTGVAVLAVAVVAVVLLPVLAAATHLHIRRCDRLGGILHEYGLAA